MTCTGREKKEGKKRASEIRNYKLVKKECRMEMKVRNN